MPQKHDRRVGSVVFVVDVVVAFISDSVVVLRLNAVRQRLFQEPVHSILVSGQLAGYLNPCLEILSFVAVECRRAPGEFSKERLEREGVVPCLDDGSQFLLRRLPGPL